MAGAHHGTEQSDAAQSQAWQLLVDPRPEAFKQLLVLLNTRHGVAVHVRSQAEGEEARKFSQHREGRHAGMSGAQWLAEAGSDRCIWQLGVCLAALAPLLQVNSFEVGPAWAAASVSPHGAKSLSDEMLATMVSAVSGHFPLPGGRSADKYTSMDVMRVAWMIAVISGRLHGDDLGPLAFEAMLLAQAAGTRQVWKKMGVGTYTQFIAMQSKLCEAVAQGAAAYPGPPAWATCGTAMLWPQVFVHICECSQALKDLGLDTVRATISQTITEAERGTLSQFILDLRSGRVPTHGRASMSLVIQELCRMRQLSPCRGSGRGGKSADAARHLSVVIDCARAGLSPKLMWWLNGNIIAIAEGLRSLREWSHTHHCQPLLASLNAPTIAKGNMQKKEICKICGAEYRKSNRSLHLRTRRHRLACGDNASDDRAMDDDVPRATMKRRSRPPSVVTVASSSLVEAVDQHKRARNS